MITRSTTAALPACHCAEHRAGRAKSAVDAIVIGVGSGGTVTGVGETIKAWTNDVRIAAVEPYESQALGGGLTGPHASAIWLRLCAGKLQRLCGGQRGGGEHHRRAAGRAKGAAHRCHPGFGGIRCRFAGGRTAHPCRCQPLCPCHPARTADRKYIIRRNHRVPMTNDMTKGAITPLLIRFTIPLVLGNLFQLTYTPPTASSWASSWARKLLPPSAPPTRS